MQPIANKNKTMYKMKRTEHQEQCTVFQWARLMAGKHPELDMLFAIPNGGARHVVVGRKLKAEGVRAGVPDICLPVPRDPYNGLFIELKTESGRATSLQTEWLDKLRQNGFCATVCRGADDAIGMIRAYLGI